MTEHKNEHKGNEHKADWEAIERDYRAGLLSIREMSRQHEISDTAIHKWAKRLGWERDLTAKVKARVRAEMLRIDDTEENGEAANGERAVEAATALGVAVLKLQRQDIQLLREQEQLLLRELGDQDTPPLKTWVGQYQGEVIERDYRIPVTERAAALHALAGVQHKRIALERQAYNLNEDTQDGAKPVGFMIGYIAGPGRPDED